MPRSAGVTVIAVLSMIGSVLTFLIGLVMVVVLMVMPLPKGTAEVPATPMFLKAMIAMGALFYIGPAIWGIFTSIGLFRLRNWARISIIVFSILLIVMSAISGLTMLVVPLPSLRNDAAGILTAIRVGMATFWFCLVAIGAWWLAYCTRPRVRTQFLPAPAGVGQLPAISPAPRRPVSVTVIAWFLLAGCAFLPFGMLLRMPAVFFNRLLTGNAAMVCYAGVLLVNLAVGIGLLRMKPAAWWGAIAYQVFTLGNSAVFFLAPGGSARLQTMMQASYSMFPWTQALQKQTGVQYDITAPVTIGAVSGLGMILVVLYLLIRARTAFQSES